MTTKLYDRRKTQIGTPEDYLRQPKAEKRLGKGFSATELNRVVIAEDIWGKGSEFAIELIKAIGPDKSFVLVPEGTFPAGIQTLTPRMELFIWSLCVNRHPKVDYAKPDDGN